MLKRLLPLLIFSACASVKAPVNPNVQKEFARGEVILATELLTKIFDQEMAPIKCVPNIDEASLLLRTINPRMEVIQDDLEAMLDSDKEINELISSCDQNCTCPYVEDLLKEHQVVLKKAQKTSLETKKKSKDINSCLNYVKETFCSSELYKTLDVEKSDFSYDEETP